MTASPPTPALGRSALHVLLIENQPEDALRVERGLRESGVEPFRVTTTTSLAEGLARLERQRFDVVLLDLALPDSRGLEGLARLRTRTPLVPVVVLTAGGEQDAVLEALQLGAQDYLLKGETSPPLLERSLRYAVWRARATRMASQRESETQLRQVAAGVPGAVYQYRVAADGRASFTFLSDGITRLTGLRPADLEDDPGRLWRLVLPEDAAVLPESLHRSAEQNQPWVRDFRLDLEGPGVRWIRASAVPNSDGQGGTVWNGIFMDVSEQRLLEEQLRQAQKMEAVGQLAGGVAHDFNNLLTAIVSSAELAQESLEGEHPAREHLRDVQGAVERGAELTRQLLAFSRRQVLRLELVRLDELVGEAERILRRVIGEDIVLVTEAGAAVPPVRADRGQLIQVLMNLAVNSRDAMTGGGRLTISTAQRVVDPEAARIRRGLIPGSYSLLVVADSGCGMDEGTRARIFEPFFTTKPVGKGTGLGLSTVYGIVKQVGGYVQVDTAPGAGTTMSVYLPTAEAQPAHEAAGRPEPAVTRGTETVLVAEDEPGVRGPVRRILSAHGYQVFEAPDGAAALALAARHAGPIHLLLTDVVMPGIGGAELARRLQEVRPDTRVLFMSGYSAEAVARQGALAPGATLLHKPFTADELVRRVREAIRGDG